MDLAWLLALHPDNTAADVAVAIGVTPFLVYRRAAQMRLVKSPEHQAYLRELHARNLTEAGKKFRFHKGQVPQNKGMRGYCAPGSEKGWFKKGHQRNDTAAVGTESIRIDGYIWVKMAERGRYKTLWREKHRLVWEAVNGPIPRKHCVVFKDGDRQNCAIGNLALITKKENMARNTVHNLPKPLVETIRLLGALKRKINGRSGKQHHHGSAIGAVQHAAGVEGQREADGH